MTLNLTKTYEYGSIKYDNFDNYFEDIFDGCDLFLLDNIHDALLKYNGDIYEPDLYAKYSYWRFNNTHKIFLINLDDITFNSYNSNCSYDELYSYDEIKEMFDFNKDDLVIPITNWA
jgi:hypothetical protein